MVTETTSRDVQRSALSLSPPLPVQPVPQCVMTTTEDEGTAHRKLENIQQKILNTSCVYAGFAIYMALCVQLEFSQASRRAVLTCSGI